MLHPPKISIVFTTYIPPGGEDRLRACRKTLESWKHYLKYEGDIHIHVADDGSPGFDEDFWRNSIDWVEEFSYSRADRQGVGASLNRAHKICWEKSPITLYAHDDWSLTYQLDLDPWVESLIKGTADDGSEIGCIRLGPSMPNLRNGTMRHLVGGWTIDFERYSFYWSQRPALYHRRFFESYGPLPVGTDSLSVDKIYNRRIIGNPKGPSVVLALFSPWRHIASVELATVVPEPGKHPPIVYREQRY